MSPIIEVAIPTWPAIGCPVCHSIGVNLDGELVCCTDEKCGAGRMFRTMIEPQQNEATRRLRLVGAHVADCAFCQRANDRRGLCKKGATLWGQWFAWLLPGPIYGAGVDE